MITWRFLHIAAIFVATCATSAGTEVCAAEQRSDFYGSLRFGSAFVEDMNFSDSTSADLGLNPKTGWTAGGALGHRFFDALRMEFDLAYTANKMNGTFQQNVQTLVPCGEFPGNPCLDPTVDGDISMLTGFAMAYYDFPLIGQIRPYVGLGVGFIDINLDVGTRATLNDGPVSRFAIIDGSDMVIGYRYSLGLTYAVGSADLTLGYMYTFNDRPAFESLGTLVSFSFDRKVKNHAVVVGLIYRF